MRRKVEKYADEISFPVKPEKYAQLAEFCKKKGIVLLASVVNLLLSKEAEFYEYLYESGVLADSDPLVKEK
jgi:hypothetical protein